MAGAHGDEVTGRETSQHELDRSSETARLKLALTLLLLFMAAEITVAVLSSSLALLSDSAHMLTDAAALAMALVAARLVSRPAKGAMTFGLGRAEILSAQANGMTLLVLGLLIVYGAIRRLISPPDVHGWPVLIVALTGVVVNLAITRTLGGHGHAGHDHAGHATTPATTMATATTTTTPKPRPTPTPRPTMAKPGVASTAMTAPRAASTSRAPTSTSSPTCSALSPRPWRPS